MVGLKLELMVYGRGFKRSCLLVGALNFELTRASSVLLPAFVPDWRWQGAGLGMRGA